ncbi:unnamed protein product [Peniophora sp. CBMAI 1063]|nr:unnamed protein product [Peniophora sp. CBMAI 1063]
MDPSPVSRLPAEVLCLIFLACARETRPTFLIHRRSQRLVQRKSGSGWLDVTQVCRTWRRAALGYPVLWSSGDLPLDMGQTWAREISARAGTTTIKVCLTFADFEPHGIPAWVQELLRDDLHRIGELRVDRGEDTAYRTIEGLGGEAPRLTAISLSFVNPRTFVPNSKLCDLLNAPTLQSIALDKVQCELSELVWPHLRHLAIHRTNVDPAHALRALSTAPVLETLSMNQLMTSRESPRISNRVHLPNLVEMNVIGEEPAVFDLWRNLELPSLVKLNVALFRNSHHLDADRMIFLLGLTRTHLLRAEASGRTLVKFIIDFSASTTMRVYCSFNPLKPFTQSNADDTIFFLYIGNPLTQPAERVGLEQIIQALPLGHCEVLDLSCQSYVIPGRGDPWSFETWSAVAPRATCVHTLRVSGPHASALAKAARASLEGDAPVIMFPFLQHLYLYSVPFGSGDSGQDLTESEIPQLCTDLVAWMKLRKDRGVTPIRKLVIRECDLYADWLAAFEDIEDLRVEWDNDSGELKRV